MSAIFFCFGLVAESTLMRSEAFNFLSFGHTGCPGSSIVQRPSYINNTNLQTTTASTVANDDIKNSNTIDRLRYPISIDKRRLESSLFCQPLPTITQRLPPSTWLHILHQLLGWHAPVQNHLPRGTIVR